jgi:hypothetical protein
MERIQRVIDDEKVMMGGPVKRRGSCLCEVSGGAGLEQHGFGSVV